jgi:hypothetical protein
MRHDAAIVKYSLAIVLGPRRSKSSQEMRTPLRRGRDVLLLILLNYLGHTIFDVTEALLTDLKVLARSRGWKWGQVFNSIGLWLRDGMSTVFKFRVATGVNGGVPLTVYR